MNHVKPTKEELEANAMKAAEEAEKILEEEKQPEKEQPKVEEKKEEFEVGEKEEIKDEEKEEIKKRYVKSSQEAQVLHARDKKVFETLDKIEEIPEPTEEELKKEFADWDVMTDFEKRIAKNDIWNGKKFGELGKMRKEFKDLEAWQSKVDTFIEDPNVLINNPKLDGKQDEFKLFCSKPSRRGVDFDDLVSSFLYEDGKSNVEHKGKMFESGNGGPKEPIKPKSDKISIEDARQLRKTDYNKYSQMLREGKIENDLT